MDLVVYNIVKDCTILLEHIICTHSESCFGDLIEQSGYLVRFISIKHFMPPCSLLFLERSDSGEKKWIFLKILMDFTALSLSHGLWAGGRPWQRATL